ncbi:MAG: hypothetical protein Ct9H300mP22_1500 [Gammaproteobacteria bacterium]|nr:MAG: hypothetical protein Ct9H300mP22_1500 [Gammaproteobacteria bacterium]
MATNLMVFTGNANPALADAIAKNIGVPLGHASIGKFSDGEVSVELNENVRGKDVFIIQPTCAPTQRKHYGIAVNGRCSAPCFGEPHHCSDSLFRICATGSSCALGPSCHQRQSCCRHDLVP